MNTPNKAEHDNSDKKVDRRNFLFGSSLLLGCAASAGVGLLANANIANADTINKRNTESESSDKYFTKGAPENKQQGKPSQSTRLYHIGLFSSDMDETIRFYTEAFGLTRKYSWNRTVATEPFASGEYFKIPYRIEFLDFGDGSYLEVFDIGKPPNELVGDYNLPLNHIALRVPDVDAAYTRAINAGAKPFSMKVDNVEWDGKPLSLKVNGTPPLELRLAWVMGPNNEAIELGTLPENGIL